MAVAEGLSPLLSKVVTNDIPFRHAEGPENGTVLEGVAHCRGVRVTKLGAEFQCPYAFQSHLRGSLPTADDPYPQGVYVSQFGCGFLAG